MEITWQIKHLTHKTIRASRSNNHSVASKVLQKKFHTGSEKTKLPVIWGEERWSFRFTFKGDNLFYHKPSLITYLCHLFRRHGRAILLCFYCYGYFSKVKISTGALPYLGASYGVQLNGLTVPGPPKEKVIRL